MEPRASRVPHVAAAVLAVVALATVVAVKRAEAPVAATAPSAVASLEVEAPALPASAASQAIPGPLLNPPPVIKAPPLKPPPRALARNESAPATSAMGSPAACRQCGTVEAVVALQEEGREPTGFQMHIRMDDGSLRTVEQRGAMAAGSRVVVDGGSVRALVAP